MTIGCFSKRLKGTRIVVTEMYIVYLPFGCWKVDEVLTHRRLLVGIKFTYLLGEPLLSLLLLLYSNCPLINIIRLRLLRFVGIVHCVWATVIRLGEFV